MAYASTHLPALALELAETINAIEKSDDALDQRINVTYNSDTGLSQISGDFPATKTVGSGKVTWTPGEYLVDANFDVTGTPIASAAPAGIVGAFVLACESIAAAEDDKLELGETLLTGTGTTVTYAVVNNEPVFRISSALAFVIDTSTGSPTITTTNHIA